MFAKHFVDEKESRHFVFRYLHKLVGLYEDGAITFQDVFYRVCSEPVLSEEEKLAIISSPTRATVLKLWRGRESKYVVERLQIPLNAVIVVENKSTMWKLAREYWFLQPVVTNPFALGIMTSLKCISTIVKGFRAPIIIPDLPWKHMDALATIVVMARLANMPIISNMPIILKEEVESYTELNPRLMSLAGAETIRLSIKDITHRFQPALRKFLLEYGYSEKAKMLYGINVEDLHWRTDWWNYLRLELKVNQELLEKALDKGLPANAAKKIATWKFENIHSVLKLLRELRLIIKSDRYFWKAIELVAEITNLRPEILLKLLEADKVSEVVESTVGREGENKKRYLIVDDEKIDLSNLG